MNRRFLTLEQLKSVASALLAKINQKPDSSSLSDVSFTGDYNDLSNRPDFSNFVNQTALQNSYEAAMQQVGEHCMVIGRDYVTAGRASTATLGTKATAEGVETIASGNYSHAEGNSTTASGQFSHAEGDNTTASGNGSHTEGNETTASGYISHAEGSFTIASGHASHTEGFYTTAQRRSQHVFGEYNVLDVTGSTTSDKGTYVEIVGNGTSSTRSNARTLDWSGNEVLAGKLTVGADPTNNMDVATKEYVDTEIAGIDALPSQTGQSGKFLTTNGTEASWATVEPEVFWVEVGGLSSNLFADKTLSEIWDAFVAGKLIIAQYNSAQYRLISVDTSYGARFVAIIPQEGNGDDFYAELFCNTADVWSRRTVTIGTQMKITASGILKGDGAGGVTAAVAGTDYAAASHNHNIENLTNFGSRVYDATISRTKNTVLAAPNGSNGAASFRALVAADIPSLTKSKISDLGAIPKLYTGFCGTAAATAAKVVTLHDATGFSLTAGTAILVHFTDGNTATSPTINVNSTGAKSLYAYSIDSSGVSGTAGSKLIPAFTPVLMVYNGTYWYMRSLDQAYAVLKTRLNRTTAVNSTDANYTTYMARGEALNSADTNPTVNGAISWTYA